VAEVFTDWELRCITAAEDGQAERCEMFQLLLDEQDNPVAVFRVSVPLVDVEDQVAAAVIVTPLETLLTPGIRVRIDDSEPVGVPFTLCEDDRLPCTHPADRGKRGGLQGRRRRFLDIFALVRSDLGEIGGVPVALSASLRGFTAAYDALQERHAEFAAWSPSCRPKRPKRGRPAGDAESEIRASGGPPPPGGPGHASGAARSTSTAFSPPKAKAFDRTASTFASRASFGTTSSAHSGSGSS
jgi:invasion protein IalB